MSEEPKQPEETPVLHPADEDPSAGTPVLHPADEDPSAGAPVRRARSRLRRFFLRHVPLAIGACAALALLLLLGLYFFASSDSFQNTVRERLAARLSNATGGRVEIASFHWRLLNLEAEADDVVIHGREAASEAPYARIERLRARVAVLGLLSPNVRLAELEINRPALHLIVYPDGSTNQPQPRQKRAQKPAIDRLFDLKAGRVSVEEGVLNYEDRAERFDAQRRMIPLDFAADDVSMRLSHVAASGRAAERYQIELGATDLMLVRGAGKTREPETHARMQATLELTRAAAALRQLQLSVRDGKTVHVFEVSGTLEDFTHPHWQAKAEGDLDLGLLEPAMGYPFAPEGVAHLNLAGKGDKGGFAVDGQAHVDNGAYVGPGATVHGVTLDTRVHADELRLLFDNTVARFKTGGQMEGTVDLRHWMQPPRGLPRLVPASLGVERGASAARLLQTGQATVQATRPTIPVDGKVTAELKNISLDTLLDIVSQPPFQRLGIGAWLNGKAEAAWSKGDNDTVVVSTKLVLNPAGHAQGETPARGVVDATYTQQDGSVQVRRLVVELPNSTLDVNGRLGAYPMTSATSLAVTLHSRGLEEFDTVLRDLELERAGRAGAAALPGRLTGQGEFIGTWTGSLLRPRIAGTAKAAQVALETGADESGEARFVQFDSIEAAGSCSPERIAIDRGVLVRGAARLSVNWTLEAAKMTATSRGAPSESMFHRDSMLHVKVQGARIGIDDLQPLVSGKLPATGMLDMGFEAHGPLGALSGSGFAELENGSLYGQAVARVQAQGSLDHSTLKLTAINASVAGGTMTGAGSYDFAARQFEVKAQGSGMEIAELDWVRRQGTTVAGKMAANVSGAGTLDDPRVEGRIAASGLTLGGKALGSLEARAHTADRALHYDVKATLAGAEVNLRGQTALSGDNLTDNRVEFTRLDLGALLKLANVEGISGESALAGTVTVAGPLKRPEALRGEARLPQLAVALAGVHLAGEGGAHATLSDGRVHLDPVHVTGENTDLHAQATVGFTGDRRLDLTASGTINMKLAETLDPDLTASGTTTFELEAHGTAQNPGLRGRIDIENGAMSLEDLPNGLSQMKGTLDFNENRLEVRNLTAVTGGGLLSVNGSLTYQHGLYADLAVTGKGVRIRYPQGVSSLADATLRLQGAPTNLLLSGDMLITRFATSPDLDLAALAAQANTKVAAVTPPNAPSNHVRLDIHLVSSPQLNFQNAYAKLAGDVDLRLRGTLASPSVLGRISITEGTAEIAGTRYELERGDITLTNPVRIEPVIDLTATARVEDYDITLGLHGTLEKMAVSYRSDPPLPESDVISLLALGHTESQERLYTQQQEQEFSSPSTDALLGGALNATMSSRMQKLFGAGSVRVDPDYLGAFGNSTSRVTVQEQVGRILTLTYATNVNTTGQQLLQAEVAINRHVSLVVARDESGVFSMVLKATRRYK